MKRFCLLLLICLCIGGKGSAEDSKTEDRDIVWEPKVSQKKKVVKSKGPNIIRDQKKRFAKRPPSKLQDLREQEYSQVPKSFPNGFPDPSTSATNRRELERLKKIIEKEKMAKARKLKNRSTLRSQKKALHDGKNLESKPKLNQKTNDSDEGKGKK